MGTYGELIHNALLRVLQRPCAWAVELAGWVADFNFGNTAPSPPPPHCADHIQLFLAHIHLPYRYDNRHIVVIAHDIRRCGWTARSPSFGGVYAFGSQWIWLSMSTTPRLLTNVVRYADLPEAPALARLQAIRSEKVPARHLNGQIGGDYVFSVFG